MGPSKARITINEDWHSQNTCRSRGDVFVSSVVSARECLDYEPAMISIEGSVSLKAAYGPPGFGEDPKHDAREDYLVLTSRIVSDRDAPQFLETHVAPLYAS